MTKVKTRDKRNGLKPYMVLADYFYSSLVSLLCTDVRKRAGFPPPDPAELVQIPQLEITIFMCLMGMIFP